MQEEKINRRSAHADAEQEAPARVRMTGAERLRRIGTEALWGCASWILGQASMAFGTYPLGLALLCGSAKHTVAILVGLILTSVSNVEAPVVYICTYLAAALIRVVASMVLDTPDARFELPEGLRRRLEAVSDTEDGTAEAREEESETRLQRIRRRMKSTGERLRTSVLAEELRDVFSESVCLRMATAALGSLIVSLYRVFAGGFRYYDLFAVIFALVMTPALVAVYSVAMERRIDSRVLRTVSEAALVFSLVYAARTVTLLGFPLSPMLALFFTLLICRSHGAVQGIGSALLCGVAYDLMMAPAFMLAALAYLFFHSMKKEGSAILLACLCTVSWMTYVGGASVLLSMIPVTLFAGAAFTLAQRLAARGEVQEDTEDADAEVRDEGRHHFESSKYRDSSDRFRGISDAFSSLSEVFYNLSDRFRRPGVIDLRRLCDEAFDTFCADCPNKTVCWGLEYSETLGTVSELISALHTRGKVSAEQIGDALSHRCPRMDSILDQINRECARLTGEMLRNNRTEIFAMDYEAAAKIINEALEEDDGEYRFDVELERKVSEYLNDAGVRAGSVAVYGSRRRRILIRGAEIEQAKVSFETMRSDLGEMCGSELGQPVFEVERNVSTMILQAQQKLAVTGAQNNVSADGGVSGDSVNLFSNKKDYFYALICDGMGAGREAALTSGLCSVFMEKMLRAGNRAGTSLRMLNNMIRSRGADSTRECSSTIDLLELDLMTGEAYFIKSGAAPSFVIRKDVVRKIHAGTVPIGIICALDAQQTRFELREGDTVVMISDGIMQSDAECEWLTSYLKEVAEADPEEIVYRICHHAAENDTHDDCSVIALRIHRAEEA
ncbi:MAG: SpoIIE family protein phosphatase [Clostridia bacterium]|nr:SpoIIE family protein phosphatase [Clostridia bacterium]